MQHPYFTIFQKKNQVFYKKYQLQKWTKIYGKICKKHQIKKQILSNLFQKMLTWLKFCDILLTSRTNRSSGGQNEKDFTEDFNNWCYSCRSRICILSYFWKRRLIVKDKFTSLGIRQSKKSCHVFVTVFFAFLLS